MVESKRYQSLLYLVVASLAALYFWLPFRFAVNIPNADDFDMILSPALGMAQNSSWIDRMKILLTPHGEHFVFFSQASAAISWILTGSLNFRSLILFGNLSVYLVLFALLISFLKTDRERLFAFIAAPIIILQPSYVESIMWCSGALQHLWSWVFCIFAIYFAFQPGAIFFVAALLLGALAAVSQGNGILLFPTIGSVYLLNKNWKLGGTYLALGLAGIVAYWITVGSAISGEKPPVTIFDVVEYALSFLGTAGGLRSLSLSMFVGAVVIGIFGAATFTGYFRRNKILFGFLLFIVGTAAVNALARAGFGVEYAVTQSRYKFTSSLSLATCYLIVSEMFRSSVNLRRFAIVSTLVAIVASSYSYLANYDQFVLRNELLNDSVLRWTISGEGLEYPDPARANFLLGESKSLGVYELPLVDPSNYVSRIERSEAPPVSGSLNGKVEYQLQNERYLLISGYLLPKGLNSKTESTKLLLSSERGSFVVNTDPRQRPDVTINQHRPPTANVGFISVIDRKELPSGEYRVTLLQSGDGVTLAKATKNIVRVD